MLAALRTAYRILSRRSRLLALLLLPAVLATGLLQVAGIGSIAPFLAVVADPSAVERNAYLARAYTRLGFADAQDFLVALGVLAFVLLLAGNLIRLLTEWGISRFSEMQRHALASALFDAYLMQPYDYFLTRNTSELGKTLLAEATEVISGVLRPALDLVSKITVSLFIVGLLVVVSPTLALGVTVVLGGAYFLIYRGMKRLLERWGRQRLAANTERYKVVAEAFSAIKDVKLLGLEGRFVKRFRGPDRNVSRLEVRKTIARLVPAHGMEVLAFGAIVAVLLFSLGASRGVGDVLPIVGIYGYAVIRLKPNLQSIYQDFSKIRYTLPALDRVVKDLERYTPRRPVVDSAAGRRFRESVALRDVTFAYPGAPPLFSGLNLTIGRGQVVGFVGRTGSGKTTVVDLLLGLLRPQSGALLVDDERLSDEALRGWQANAGYVPQQIRLLDDTISRNIALGLPDEEIDPSAVERAARAACIHDFIAAELPDGYGTIVGEQGIRLSGGQRQRLGIARALYRDPQLLVLDEATSALDDETETAVMEAIESLRGEKTLLLIAHRTTTVQSCDVIHVLEAGRLAASGRYEDVIMNARIGRPTAPARSGSQTGRGR
jgi:ATP-binding cassette, subfamily B, bacterial PglK